MSVYNSVLTFQFQLLVKRRNSSAAEIDERYCQVGITPSSSTEMTNYRIGLERSNQSINQSEEG